MASSCLSNLSISILRKLRLAQAIGIRTPAFYRILRIFRVPNKSLRRIRHRANQRDGPNARENFANPVVKRAKKPPIGAGDGALMAAMDSLAIIEASRLSTPLKAAPLLAEHCKL